MLRLLIDSDRARISFDPLCRFETTIRGSDAAAPRFQSTASFTHLRCCGAPGGGVRGGGRGKLGGGRDAAAFRGTSDAARGSGGARLEASGSRGRAARGGARPSRCAAVLRSAL